MVIIIFKNNYNTNFKIIDLEWKLIYVSSAYNSDLDQVLDSVLVGPIPIGRHQFVLDVSNVKLLSSVVI